MKHDNVAAVRNAYAVAERKDLEGWINLFTPDGVFTDNSVGATYRGRALADPVRNYGTGKWGETTSRNRSGVSYGLSHLKALNFGCSR
jgi:hypothetical protein